MLLRLGPSGRTFESCHSDHMKMIRTFFSLESRSDYLYYLIIQISTVRNKYRYHSRLSMVSAFLCNRSLLDSIVILRYNEYEQNNGRCEMILYHGTQVQNIEQLKPFATRGNAIYRNKSRLVLFKRISPKRGILLLK